MFEIASLQTSFVKAPAPVAHKHWGRVYDEMTVHTQGKRPDKLIRGRRPYEDDGITKYRLEAFQPITKDAINRAIQNLQRLFSVANYRFTVDPQIHDYITANNFDDKDLMGYVSSDVVRRMIEDPNGCLVWWPTGEGLTDPAQSVTVKPILVLSKRIHAATDEVLMWLSDEKSPVAYGNQTRIEGEVYYAATNQGFFKVIQYGRKADKTFRTEVIYLQTFSYAPYIVLGGEASQYEDADGQTIHYLESYFNCYLPSANEAIRQFSDYQGVAVTAMFPIREMQPINCVAPGCRGGKIIDEDGNKSTCSSCNGTGYIAPPSPYGVLMRPQPQGMGEEASSVPALRYISPDVAILKHAEDYWKGLLKDAEKALNLIFIDEAQSGVAKTIDREDKEAAIDRIGANVYNNILRNSLIIIGDLLTMGNAAEPVIYLPPTFRIKTESEITQEIAALRKDGAPDFVLAEATRDLMQRRYGNDPAMIRMVDLLAEFDTFFALSTAQKRDLFASGAMEEREYLFSVHAPKYLRQLSKLDEFLALSSEEVRRRLDALLQPVINRRPVE